MIRAVIIDDEKNGAEVLKLLVEQNFNNVEILTIAHNVEHGIKAIQQHKPDLIFLDIEMPDGTGFDVVESTKGFNYQVIFTTAYEQYAIKALKAKAINYLLKPIDLNELIDAVNDAVLVIEKDKSTVPDNLEKAILDVLNKSKKISVPTSDGVLMIEIDEIVRLEADSNYTNIFLLDGKKVMASKTLKHFDEALSKHNFCRVHSTHVVNMKFVERYIRGDGGTLILKDGKNIPVSRANKNDVLGILGIS